jgi:hypothetical protein
LRKSRSRWRHPVAPVAGQGLHAVSRLRCHACWDCFLIVQGALGTRFESMRAMWYS